MKSLRSAISLAHAFAVLLLCARCSYDTTVPNAVLSCVTAADCPAGFACVALGPGAGAVCCRDGDCGKGDAAAVDASPEAARPDLPPALDAGSRDGAGSDRAAPDAPAADLGTDQATAPPADAASDAPPVIGDAPPLPDAPAVIADAPAVIADAPPAMPDAPAVIADAPAMIADAPAMIADAPAVIADASAPDQPPPADALEPDSAGPPDMAPPPCPSTGRGPELVWVASPSFCVDSTEVTNAQYQAFLDDVKSNLLAVIAAQPAGCRKDNWKTDFTPDTDITPWPQPGRANQPVVSVDWCDAWTFCHWAGKRLCGRLGGGGGLPHGGSEPVNEFTSADDFTQSEWAYACSGAGANQYPYGATFSTSACNTGHTGTSNETYTLTKAAGVAPRCEGGYPGLFDMSGNVEEWVDGCTANNGPTDNCAVVGGSLYSQKSVSTAEETSCKTSSYASPRTDAYQLRGIRCCGL